MPARLLRGFAVDFLTAHAPAVVERIMHPDYRLSIGGYLLAGRDAAYLPATAAQLDLFPGLCVTVHDVVLSPDAVAMRFTEHGVSAREGRASSWGGVTLFRIEGGQLREGWAEEDYLARKRQLRSGLIDPIAAPHPAPWDEPVRDPDPATEAAVRAWLADPAAPLAEAWDIGVEGPRLARLVVPRSLRLSALVTAGDRAAFHALVQGERAGGGDAATGSPVELCIAGIVDVADGRVTRAQVCGDRLGLQRRLPG